MPQATKNPTINVRYSKLACLGYLVLVALVPVAAYVFTLFSGKNNFLDIIARFYLLIKEFLVLASSFTPMDYVLAAIVVLYVKKWKVSASLLATGGLLFLIGKYSGEFVNKLISRVGSTDPSAYVIECFYTAFAVALIVGSVGLPSIVAYFRKKKSFKIILIVDLLLGWVLPVWVALIFFAFKNDKDKSAKKDTTTGETSVVTPPKKVHQRKPKRKKGFKKK